MTPEVKQNEIKKAIKEGTPKGNTARKLLTGEKIPEKKIDEMYENLLEYRKNPEKYRKINESYRDYCPEISEKEKIEKILQAEANGVAKSHLDPNGIGDAVRKLQKGKVVGIGKVNEMYARVLLLQGKETALPEKKIEAKEDKKNGQVYEEQIAALKKQLSLLQKQVKELKKIQKGKENKKKQIIKVLGVTLVEKTDKVRDKKYKRWYGTFRENGKQYWIYIGGDITKAREKVRNYLEGRKGETTCKN